MAKFPRSSRMQTGCVYRQESSFWHTFQATPHIREQNIHSIRESPKWVGFGGCGVETLRQVQSSIADSLGPGEVAVGRTWEIRQVPSGTLWATIHHKGVRAQVDGV